MVLKKVWPWSRIAYLERRLAGAEKALEMAQKDKQALIQKVRHVLGPEHGYQAKVYHDA